MRAGPDVEFPPVAVIPEGEPVYIKGCLRDELWCDVVWEDDRGWVYSEYLALDYRGELMPLPDVGLVEFRIPIVSFAATDYWGRYYVGRPWYRERDRWFSYRIRSRQGWMPRHRVRAALAGGAPGITRLLACVLLLIADGDVLSITVREDFGMTEMSVAGTEAIGAAAGATNGVTKEVISDRDQTREERDNRERNRRGERGDDRGRDTSREDRRDRGPARREDSVSREVQGDGVAADAKGPTAAVKRAVIVDIMESVAAIAAMRVMTGAGEHCAWLAGKRAR